MLKVYGRANSINVRKVLWMLGELGLPYEREDWGRGYRPTADPVFRAINPVGVVPVIDDEGFRLRESNTIVRYLADKHGRADLYPKDLKERATVESWMDWGSTEFANGMRPVFHALVVKNPAFAGMVESAAKEWAGQMQVLDDHLAKNGPFVTGQNFTVADIPAGLVVNRWYSIDFKKPEFKACAAYYDALAERPPYREHGRNGTP
jgi:glutathione S-transferase